MHLVEQVILMLGHASLSVSYTRPLNFLKMITKGPGKAKAMLKVKKNTLKKRENYFLRKRFDLI